MLLYNIRTHPFFLKRDFSKRLLNDEFQKFWEKKKRKNPVVSHLACTTGFFRLPKIRKQSQWQSQLQ